MTLYTARLWDVHRGVTIRSKSKRCGGGTPILSSPCKESSSFLFPQSMEATKVLLRHSLRKKLDAALESETYLLVQQWCSAECQTAIKAYIDGKIQ